MEFLTIFTKQDKCNLWSTLYPDEEKDIFSQLLEVWSDTEYLFNFFVENQKLLDFWNLNVDQAINRVIEEVERFSDELWAIETEFNGYEEVSLNDIFLPLHNNTTSLNWENEAQRKGRSHYYKKPMLRLYAIELEDNCMIITGGAIKLTREMDDKELDKLKRVQNFLKDQKINSREGLLN